jgi:hypothetical protein
MPLKYVWKKVEGIQKNDREIKLTSKRIVRLAIKLGCYIIEGRKHILIKKGNLLITTIPRSKIKERTLEAILGQMEIKLGISKSDLKNML